MPSFPSDYRGRYYTDQPPEDGAPLPRNPRVISRHAQPPAEETRHRGAATQRRLMHDLNAPALPAHLSSPGPKEAYLVGLLNWRESAPPRYRKECRRVAAVYAAACNRAAPMTLEIRDVTSLPLLYSVPEVVKCLSVINCRNLASLPDLSRCHNLEYLVIEGCPRLTTLPDLSQCHNLKGLVCVACPSLTGRFDLLQCVQLKSVMWDCPISARLPEGMILDPDQFHRVERSLPRRSLRAPLSRPVSYVMQEPPADVRQPPEMPRPALPPVRQVPASVPSRPPAVADPVVARPRAHAVFVPAESASHSRQHRNASRPPPPARAAPAAGRAREAAFAAIDAWQRAAPEEHRQVHEEIASKIKAAWKDVSTTSLSIWNQDIVDLPPLPAHLTELNLMNCARLVALPDLSSCLKLQKLQLAGCGELAELPDLSAHQGLQQVNLLGVTVAAEPRYFLGLPKRCQVTFEASRVTHEVYASLNDVMSASSYQGPTLRFLGGLRGESAFPLRTLTGEVKSWLPASDIRVWKEIQKETNAHLFSQYLANIRGTADYKESQPLMMSRIAALLGQLQQLESQALRQDCFNIAMCTDDTCGDGIAAALLDMELQCISYRAQADIEAGKYDAGPAGLVALGKGMYLYESLKKIAQEKIRTLEEQQPETPAGNIDETEVNYGYFLRFNTLFSELLGVRMNAMLYPRSSRITDQDEQDAVAILKSQAHQDGWRAFLATWPLTDALLVRIGHADIVGRVSTRIEQEKARIAGAMDELFDSREAFSSQAYQHQLQALAAEYDGIEVKVSMEEKQGTITRLLKRYRLEERLL